MSLVQRWDLAVAAAGRFERTPQGGVRARARFTRAGVLTYDLPDGTQRREYRPPDEVFAPESLETMADAPITVHHPDSGEVTAADYQKLAVGHISGAVEQEDGHYVAGRVVIQDATAARMAESGSLAEFSAGYQARLDMTPGTTPDGEPYDAVQRGIRYNHVAFLPPGTGRAGPEVSLRLDAAGQQIAPAKENPKMEMTHEEVAALKALLAIAPQLEALVAAPAEEPAVEDAAAPAEAPAEEPVEVPTAAGTAPMPVEDMEEEPKLDSAAIARMVNDAAELRVKALRVLGEADLSGLSNRDVMVRVVRHVDGKDPEGSDDYVRGRFDSALTKAAEQKAADHGALRSPAPGGAPAPVDYTSTLAARVAGASRRG